MATTNTNKGQTMNVRKLVTDVNRAQRIGNSLNTAGITMKLVEKRNYHSMRFDGYGRLQDGKIRITHRIEVSGNTYQVRSVLKAAGYRWDAKSKVWYAKPNAPMNSVGAAILRTLAN